MQPILASYLHNLDPFAIFFGDSFPIPGIRWYGLSYLCGFLVAFYYATKITKNGISTLKIEHASDYIMATAIGVFVGGRVGYVLFYKPSLLFEFSAEMPYWSLFAINNGGMASHGGMLGVLIATCYYGYKHKHKIAHLWDISCFVVPMGLFFGRLANFVNGELYGRPCDKDMPFAVKFPQEMFDWTTSQNADQIVKLQNAFSHLPLEARNYPVTQSIPTIIEKMNQGNQALIDIVEPLLVARHPSQLYEGILEGIILFAVMLIAWRTPKKPLFVSGIFAITYGLLRFVVEYFRTPDQHLLDAEFAAYNITRGQLLSVPLIIIGFIFLYLAKISKSEKMGGWKKQTTTT